MGTTRRVVKLPDNMPLVRRLSRLLAFSVGIPTLIGCVSVLIAVAWFQQSRARATVAYIADEAGHSLGSYVANGFDVNIRLALLTYFSPSPLISVREVWLLDESNGLIASGEYDPTIVVDSGGYDNHGRVYSHGRVSVGKFTDPTNDYSATLVEEASVGARTADVPPDGGGLHTGSLVVSSIVTHLGVPVGRLVWRCSLDALYRELAFQLGAILLGVSVVFFVTLTFGRRIARRITEPLSALAAASSTIAADRDYSTRLSGGGGDEIGLAVHAFNRMLDEVQARDVALDVARKEAEAARAEAELANREKTTFLTAAGHDLRQPMHALVQYFGHLRRNNRDQSLVETIGRIGKSLDAMEDLLDSILEVSKLMMGAVKPSIIDFRLSDLLDRTDAQMRPIAEDKGLRFEVSSSKVMVRTDPILLERIVRNLLLNAIRYTNQGGVTLRTKQRGEKLILQVSDSGIGIPRDQRDRIFEAFYQLGNEARNRHKGLGLGLAIVKQLSELLEIQVYLRSKEGKGSIFSVVIPMGQEVAAPAAGAEPIAPEPDSAKGASVVLIDDNIASLEATALSLSAFGCHVLTATSGMNAIERLQGQEFIPNLLISDYRLDDGENGLDAIKMVVENLKALWGDDFVIPSIVLSGDTAPAELEKVQQAGFPMLHKPVQPEKLYAAVNEQLMALATGKAAC